MQVFHDSYASESIFNWTIGTFEDLLLLCGFMPGDGAKGQNTELFKL